MSGSTCTLDGVGSVGGTRFAVVPRQDPCSAYERGETTSSPLSSRSGVVTRGRARGLAGVVVDVVVFVVMGMLLGIC